MSQLENGNGILDESGDRHDSYDETLPCYVFKPPVAGEGPSQPPKKRKKVSHKPEALSTSHGTLFVPLLDGREERQHVDDRNDAFKKTWSSTERVLKGVLEEGNTSIVQTILHFLDNINPTEQSNQIPACLITTGPAVLAHEHLFDVIADKISLERKELIITLTPSQCPNLKTALKTIIQIGISQQSNANDNNDDDEINPESHQSMRLLNYDLQNLHDYMKRHALKTVIVAFQSTESFDGNILAELIDIFRSWKDRIPSVFLFEIAVSIDNFKVKMARAAMRHLRGVALEATSAEQTTELMFKAVTAPENPRSMWIGPGISKALLDRQLEHIQSSQAFIQALKYACMTHFFANPLTVVLKSNDHIKRLQSEHYEAMRDLPSFRRFIQDLIKNGELDKAEGLLEHDNVLRETASELLVSGQKALNDLLRALDLLYTIQMSISDRSRLRWSEVYVKGFSTGFAQSTYIRDILLSIKKLPSNIMEDMLDELPKIADFDFSDIKSDLKQLSAAADSSGPLRSEFDMHHEVVRTTVVAQKVALSKHKPALSKQDTAYSKVVYRIHDLLKKVFDQCLINPKDLVLHEIFLFDLKSSCRDAFSPLPRFAVERALSVPHDYLDCDCCDAAAGSLSPTQPPTAILYQLYLESGAIINISDLWSAFYTIVGPEQDEEGGTTEESAMALFYRALAELRYLGFIKNSRKKSDHLTKLAWKGL